MTDGEIIVASFWVSGTVTRMGVCPCARSAANGGYLGKKKSLFQMNRLQVDRILFDLRSRMHGATPSWSG
jgi:hypothetical protein